MKQKTVRKSTASDRLVKNIRRKSKGMGKNLPNIPCFFMVMAMANMDELLVAIHPSLATYS